MHRLQGRRVVRRRRVPQINVPRMIQADYYLRILRLLKKAKELVDRDVHQAILSLVAERQDTLRTDGPEDFSRVIDGIRLEYGRIVDRGTLEDVAEGAAASVLNTNRRLSSEQFRAILGVDVLAGDPPLAMAMQVFTIENVGLIKTISSRYFDEVESTVFRNWRAGRRPSEIEAEIAGRYDVSKGRARVIARDQTNKLNGQLNQARQNNLGIQSYRWRNAGDERVRGNPGGLYPDAEPSHWSREGKVYRWDEPPEDGHPGEPIQCRCWPEPIIPGVNG